MCALAARDPELPTTAWWTEAVSLVGRAMEQRPRMRNVLLPGILHRS